MQKRLAGSPADACLALAGEGPAEVSIDHKTLAQAYNALARPLGDVDA